MHSFALLERFQSLCGERVDFFSSASSDSRGLSQIILVPQANQPVNHNSFFCKLR